MSSLSLLLSISPISAPTTAAVFNATVSFVVDGPSPSGISKPFVNGAAIGDGFEATDTSQTFTIAFNDPSPPGQYSIMVRYSGDANYTGTFDSNSVTVTVTDSQQPTLAATQARGRAVCKFVAGVQPSRADIEVGVQTAQGFRVTGISMLASGSVQYDAFSTATLFGKVAGVATRQPLTITLDGTGGIAQLSGFDETTVWDSVPAVWITRWDGESPDASFLGY